MIASIWPAPLDDLTLRTVAFGLTALGAVAGVVGTFAVVRRQSLQGDAISHAALPGVALAFIYGARSSVMIVVGAAIAGWIAMMIERDFVDLDATDGQTLRTKAMESRAELLKALEDGAAKARAALEGTTEEHLMTQWKIVMGERVLGEGVRYSMIANSAISHMAHHRGQLTVYLRLNEAKVPAIYGPSADEWH